MEPTSPQTRTPHRDTTRVMPDARFLVLLAPLVVLYVIHGAVDSVVFRLFFYAVNLLFWLSYAVISFREGRCFDRPFITREEEPVTYWLAMTLASGLAIASVGGFWGLLIGH